MDEHLRAVAAQAAQFADYFGLRESARLAGLWHDAGKYSPEFQQYLRDCHADAEAERAGQPPKYKRRCKLNHSSVGALGWGKAFPPLSMVIAAHHRGLYDRTDWQANLGKWREDELVGSALALAGEAHSAPEFNPVLATEWQAVLQDAHAAELLTRLLFSALVDADRLDTEAFWDPDKHEQRGQYPELPALLPHYEAFMERKAQEALERDGGKFGAVNAARAEILKHCLAAAAGKSGVYRLTVPTGGGKTLASLGFALRHALAHGLRRIVMAIPYTSIIDQTAQVYREVFKDLGCDAVLEHHSALGEGEHSGGADVSGRHVDRGHGGPRHQDEPTDDERRRELACENWDAPLIVTTTVQLFDSLLSHKPRAMRKLHNLARSVIILDEAQTLPADMLSVYVNMLDGLARHAGCTVVLCTATQPGLSAMQGEERKRFHFSADQLRGEIVPEPERYFERLRRVEYDLRVGDGHAPWSWEDVAREMLAEEQCLCILNTKKDALAVLDALESVAGTRLAASSGAGVPAREPREFAATEGRATGDADHGVFHLSTLLCGAHRKQVLEEVRQRLKDGLPVRLVSTQVVEAGVDLDFPLVMRALGPLDRIVQAAGRCNREGRRESGRVIVYVPADGGKLPGLSYTTATNTTSAMLAAGEIAIDMPEGQSEYFRRYFCRVDPRTDSEGTDLHEHRSKYRYKTVAQYARLIEETPTEGVIVAYDEEGKALSRALEAKFNSGTPPTKSDYRAIQRYTVTMNSGTLGKLGHLVVRYGDVTFWRGGYNELRGLVTTTEFDPDIYCV